MSTPQPTIIAAQLREWAPFMPSHARDLLDQAAASLDGRTEPCDPVLAERRACAAISPNGLNISAAAMPHEVWAKYRDAILARGTGESTPRTCRCGPDGCADSACPGRAPTETPSAWDTKALDVARTILAIEGNDRGQLTARVQLAVLDAMRWAAPVAPAEPAEGWVLVPKRMTQEMRDVTDSEGWTWEDLLAEARSISQEEYAAIAAEPVAPAEPVATLHDDGYWTAKKTEAGRLLNDRLRYAGTRVDVYTAPVAPAFDILAHLARQCEFSARTFGPGPRIEGVTDHIAKELIEARESGGALAEWVDVIILAFDGAWRSGATPQQIIDAMVAKQTKNEGRVWPDWRTAPAGKAIEHDRSGKGTSA